METLVRVEGHRWAIQDGVETANNASGFDHDEIRSWHGGHRHVPLVMPAFAMTTVIRQHANAAPHPKTIRRARRQFRSDGRCREPPRCQPHATAPDPNPAMSSHGRFGDGNVRPQQNRPIFN